MKLSSKNHRKLNGIFVHFILLTTCNDLDQEMLYGKQRIKVLVCSMRIFNMNSQFYRFDDINSTTTTKNKTKQKPSIFISSDMPFNTSLSFSSTVFKTFISMHFHFFQTI